MTCDTFNLHNLTYFRLVLYEIDGQFEFQLKPRMDNNTNLLQDSTIIFIHFKLLHDFGLLPHLISGVHKAN